MTVALVVAEPTLDELAETVKREHDLCLEAALSSVTHAIRAGEALLAAKERVPRGTWERWVDETCPAVSRMAKPYMRLAAYKAMIPAETRTAVDALAYLRGLPAFDGSGPAQHPPEIRDEALRLIDDGFSQRQVSQMLGISRKCIRRWLSPDGPEGGREGDYRRRRGGRPTAAQKRESVERMQKEARTIGAPTLIARFRAVAEAHRERDKDALLGSLRDLAEAATSWAERLEGEKS